MYIEGEEESEDLRDQEESEDLQDKEDALPPRAAEEVDSDVGELEEQATNNRKQYRWWWVTVQLDTEEEATSWTPPAKPRADYCCWRPHKAPTTGKPHVHYLVYYHSASRFETLQKKGFSNIRYLLTAAQKRNARKYCQDDNHRDGTVKGVLAPFREEGSWPRNLDAVVDNKNKRAQTDEVCIYCNMYSMY